MSFKTLFYEIYFTLPFILIAYLVAGIVKNGFHVASAFIIVLVLLNVLISIYVMKKKSLLNKTLNEQIEE